MPSWYSASSTLSLTIIFLFLTDRKERSSTWDYRIPSVPFKIKEFAYFGFGITLLSASIAHFARGDARLSVFFIIDPLFFLVLLILSYVYFEKSHSLSARQSPEG